MGTPGTATVLTRGPLGGPASAIMLQIEMSPTNECSESGVHWA